MHDGSDRVAGGRRTAVAKCDDSSSTGTVLPLKNVVFNAFSYCVSDTCFLV